MEMSEKRLSKNETMAVLLLLESLSEASDGKLSAKNVNLLNKFAQTHNIKNIMDLLDVAYWYENSCGSWYQAFLLLANELNGEGAAKGENVLFCSPSVGVFRRGLVAGVEPTPEENINFIAELIGIGFVNGNCTRTKYEMIDIYCDITKANKAIVSELEDSCKTLAELSAQLSYIKSRSRFDNKKIEMYEKEIKNNQLSIENGISELLDLSAKL